MPRLRSLAAAHSPGELASLDVRQYTCWTVHPLTSGGRSLKTEYHWTILPLLRTQPPSEWAVLRSEPAQSLAVLRAVQA